MNLLDWMAAHPEGPIVLSGVSIVLAIVALVLAAC